MSYRRRYFLSLIIICLSSALFYHVLTLTSTIDTDLNGSPNNNPSILLPPPTNSFKFNKVELGLDNYRIEDFALITSEDVWAVGQIGVDGLVLHFDGTSWERIDLPDYRDLKAIQALSRDNIWLIGGCNKEAYLIHFDGKAWTDYRDLPLPIVENWQEDSRCPLALDMISDQEGWVAGRFGMLLHFKSGKWTQFQIPI